MRGPKNPHQRNPSGILAAWDPEEKRGLACPARRDRCMQGGRRVRGERWLRVLDGDWSRCSQEALDTQQKGTQDKCGER